MKTLFPCLPVLGGLLVLTALLFPAAGCYYDNLEKLYPELLLNEDCDTSRVISYRTDIAPILEVSCGANDNSCHTAYNVGGGYVFDRYSNVKSAVNDGKFLSSITWNGNAIRMPKGSSAQLGDCTIAKIEKWIDAGSPDN